MNEKWVTSSCLSVEELVEWQNKDVLALTRGKHQTELPAANRRRSDFSLWIRETSLVLIYCKSLCPPRWPPNKKVSFLSGLVQPHDPHKAVNFKGWSGHLVVRLIQSPPDLLVCSCAFFLLKVMFHGDGLAAEGRALHCHKGQTLRSVRRTDN